MFLENWQKISGWMFVRICNVLQKNPVRPLCEDTIGNGLSTQRFINVTD